MPPTPSSAAISRASTNGTRLGEFIVLICVIRRFICWLWKQVGAFGSNPLLRFCKRCRNQDGRKISSSRQSHVHRFVDDCCVCAAISIWLGRETRPGAFSSTRQYEEPRPSTIGLVLKSVHGLLGKLVKYSCGIYCANIRTSPKSILRESRAFLYTSRCEGGCS
jgi:hypothetical protein